MCIHICIHAHMYKYRYILFSITKILSFITCFRRNSKVMLLLVQAVFFIAYVFVVNLRDEFKTSLSRNKWPLWTVHSFWYLRQKVRYISRMYISYKRYSLSLLREEEAVPIFSLFLPTNTERQNYIFQSEAPTSIVGALVPRPSPPVRFTLNTRLLLYVCRIILLYWYK